MTYRAWTVIAVFFIASGVALAVFGNEPSSGLAVFVERKDVCFPHEMHFTDLEIECETCHHETNATALKIPHEEYFEDFWIDCTTCHKHGGPPAASAACSSCHHDSPSDIADETLSSKVVIHKSCWKCHEAGTGAQASQSCSFCHNGSHHHSVADQTENKGPAS